MKRGLIMFALAAAGVVLLAIFFTLSGSGPRRDVEQTRQTLRREGFKTDLADFNFSTTLEMSNRTAALAAVGMGRAGLGPERLDMMAPVGPDSALVLWQLPVLPSRLSDDGWPALHESLDSKRDSLDVAARIVLASPLKFNLQSGAGTSMLLPHLAPIRNLSQTFADRAVLELHDWEVALGEGVHSVAFSNNKNDAWTNLLATTHFVTGWEPEPAEVSHLVHFSCVELAFKTTWQVMQAGGWEDDRLAALQHEWETVDFFKSLPETVAFARASMSAASELERRQPPISTGFSLKQFFRSPSSAWDQIKSGWQQYRYRHRGSYEDEKAALLYYRDREREMQQAVKCTTWIEMSVTPAVTNSAMVPPSSRPNLQWRRVNPGGPMIRVGALARRIGPAIGSPLGRAAESEARRRILITAIALERFHARHGNYPKALAELSPELLPKPLLDFMDGQPLRYRRTEDGHFVLYSIGLNVMDNGGQFTSPALRRPGISNFPLPRLGIEPGALSSLYTSPLGGRHSEILWPRPASSDEVKARLDENQHEEEMRVAALEAQVEQADQAAEERRKASVQELMDEIQARKNEPPAPDAMSEPTYNFRPLSQMIGNTNVLGTNHLSMDKLLSLKQIFTGDEPAKATFELPISYDAVTNLGELKLLLDGQINNTNDSADLEYGMEQSCERGTNGDCLLVWNTTYDAPGQHVIQANFTLARQTRHPLSAAGPVMPYYSSNLCQFSERYTQFESGVATIYARLAESNGLYSIEIKSPNGEHVRTFAGRTTNGVVKIHWDMTGEHGAKYTNDSFQEIYNITLPDSGRSQTIK